VVVQLMAAACLLLRQRLAVPVQAAVLRLGAVAG